MEFRWVAAITLWTILSGPVFVDFAVSKPAGHKTPSTKAVLVRQQAQR